MEHNDFLDFLARQVLIGAIDLSVAQMLAGYDERFPMRLPLLPREVVVEITDDENEFWWLVLVSVLAAMQRTPVGADFYTRRQTANLIQEKFVAEVRTLAREANRNVASWQRQLTEIVRRHYVWMGQIAVGRPLNTPELAALNVRLIEVANAPLVALAAYGEATALRSLQGEPYSEAYHANRSILYAGGALAVFYVLASQEYIGREGWIVRYIAHDDPRTCLACSASDFDGPYLPGRAPEPGEVCLGRGYCRCELRFEYNPVEYKRLTGG